MVADFRFVAAFFFAVFLLAAGFLAAFFLAAGFLLLVPPAFFLSTFRFTAGLRLVVAFFRVTRFFTAIVRSPLVVR
ncbi:MAG: hypothetical protein B7Z66_05750 [Chromatiales bacterium 21-64-14]|nr:MAG: hypothetical protein B7Z66_05750 [Chromatiales bacterium 21-64-14]